MNIGKTCLAKEVFESESRKPIIVVRRFMYPPHERDLYDYRTTGLQDAVSFSDHSFRLAQVLQCRERKYYVRNTILNRQWLVQIRKNVRLDFVQRV